MHRSSDKSVYLPWLWNGGAQELNCESHAKWTRNTERKKLLTGRCLGKWLRELNEDIRIILKSQHNFQLSVSLSDLRWYAYSPMETWEVSMGRINTRCPCDNWHCPSKVVLPPRWQGSPKCSSSKHVKELPTRQATCRVPQGHARKRKSKRSWRKMPVLWTVRLCQTTLTSCWAWPPFPTASRFDTTWWARSTSRNFVYSWWVQHKGERRPHLALMSTFSGITQQVLMPNYKLLPLSDFMTVCLYPSILFQLLLILHSRLGGCCSLSPNYLRAKAGSSLLQGQFITGPICLHLLFKNDPYLISVFSPI